MIQNSENTSPGIIATREWISDVVKQGTCPPLRMLARENRDAEGNIIWEDLSKKIEIIDLSQKGFDEISATTVSNLYIDFMRRAITKTGPMSVLVILPDFETNALFNEFLTSMKGAVTLTLLDEEQQLFEDVLDFWKDTKDEAARKDFNRLRKIGEIGNFELIQHLYSRIFATFPFYGKDLTDKDLASLDKTRGPLERYKFIARAPFYTIQFLDTLHFPPSAKNIDFEALMKRNTDLALSPGAIDDVQKRMEELRDQNLD